LRLENEEDIRAFIAKDKELMKILTLVRELNLPDCWVCAGFLRARVWDYQVRSSHQTPVHDVDVVYFDNKFIDYDYEQKIQARLKKRAPEYNWEVKNEARMHVHSSDADPYVSSTDAIAKFPETVTAIGARLDEDNDIVLTAPHGVGDLLKMIVRPTPFAKENKKRMMVYKKRMAQKNWQNKWPSLKISMD
jgi:hypothetical protein